MKKHYINLLTRFREQGYNFYDFDNYENESSLVLRHDIDFSVEEAYKIAILESSLEVKSTFFFMLSSNMYNLMSKVNRSLIHEIHEMGHKISLHFDPTVYPSLDPFLDEKNYFERAFNTRVEIVSIHRPGIFLKDNNQDLFGVHHTYQDRYFNDMAYISDSGGKSIDKKIEMYASQKNLPGLQLLLHPIWWTRTSHSPTETLNLWRESNTSFITNEIYLNCKTYGV